ncbi:butyrate kinase [Staphylococcus shinii]|uniref:Probable butyrate kinase n=1 Tax=Staphylococcus shinii TaxID=2912228 RepID=A0A418IGW4_9STAP|nr:butyrate kinase [Staphylococcus shinii]MDW8565077.1 butyrate kinase [Staphylococcus shinii]MDW8568320.1 butyrate kinase [Staphylococcus shinii]PKI15576.1 butyrate kinase [Staphylococcus shinii]PTI66163.1 butyrate kinase [Staphylococcus shinii]RIN01669.1 butyrate kinase [Staphylococcus shinii]
MARILVLNLGSTSSKVAVYEAHKCMWHETIRHDIQLTSASLIEQKPARLNEIISSLNHTSDYTLKSFDAIACRGGLLKPMQGGVYHINNEMYNNLKAFKYGVHASNLSGMIGYELGKELNIPAFTIDPVVVDELIDIAKVTGLKNIERRSIFHALNQKAVARLYASSIHKTYEDINVIVAHMGGGITIGAHKKGQVVDVNEGLLGEGPFSPERAGSIPNDQLYAFGYNHNFTPQEMNHFLSKKGGFISMFKTNDLKLLSDKYDSNSEVKLAFDALAYQISNAIGARSIIFRGQVDQIILTGGLSYSKLLVQKIISFVDWIAPVTIYPGEKEMDTLALRTSNVLDGKEKVKAYS